VLGAARSRVMVILVLVTAVASAALDNVTAGSNPARNTEELRIEVFWPRWATRLGITW
jgi:hypothetical protein